MSTPAGPRNPDPRSVVARRRAALSDDTGHRPHLRLDPGPGNWRRRVLEDKNAADAAISETSGQLAETIAGLDRRDGRPGLMPGGGDGAGNPVIGKLTVVALIVLLAVVAPRMFAGVLAWTSGGASVLFPLALVGFGAYVIGSRWYASKRASLAAEGVDEALADLESDAAHRLRGIIAEWYHVDDTRGIGTLLERAYADGLDAETELGIGHGHGHGHGRGLEQSRRNVVDAIDAALDRGHAALGELEGSAAGSAAGSEAGSAAGGHADRLARIDATDRSYLQLRFYRRALEARD